MSYEPQFPRDTPLIDYDQQTAWIIDAFRQAFASPAVQNWWQLALEWLSMLQRTGDDELAAVVLRRFHSALACLVDESQRASPRLEHALGRFLWNWMLAGLIKASGRDDWEIICPPKIARFFLPDGTPNIIEVWPHDFLKNYGQGTKPMRHQLTEYFNLAIADQPPRGRRPWSGGRFRSPEEFRAMVIRDLRTLRLEGRDDTQLELARLWYQNDHNPAAELDSLVAQIKRYCRTYGIPWEFFVAEARRT